MINIFYAGNSEEWDEYKLHLNQALDKFNISYRLTKNLENPLDIDYIIYAPNGELQDFAPFKNVKLVQGLWAGVEVPLANKSLTQPLARMVEPGLSLGMVDYVMGHVLRYHLGTDRFHKASPGEWLGENIPPLSKSRSVGILGLGALGMHCANKLSEFGFKVSGWSRSEKKHSNIKCFYGTSGLNKILSTSEILVLLLPNTKETKEIINKKSIEKMLDGVSIINPGRGTLINDDDLISALDTGKISGATLDTFCIEPLPKKHAYWSHPNVLVTPHVASTTRINTACAIVAKNIHRGETKKPFMYLVDKLSGY